MGVDVLLAPGMNLHRNPLCGRNFEYFSEDPLLSGKIGAACVRGVQSQGVGVSLKHFFGNNQEINRMENDSRIGARALRELYLKNFEIAVRESSPWTIMSSYNKVNGVCTQQNLELLQTVLRDEWGFGGVVVTDWGTKFGTAAAVHAGNDIFEPGMPIEPASILKAINEGALDVEDLDRNVLPLRGGSNVALFGLDAYKTIAGGTGSGNANKAYVVNVDEGLSCAGFSLDPGIAELYKTYRSYMNSEDACAPILPKQALGGSVPLGEGVMPEMPVRREVVANSVARNDAAVVVIGRNAGEGDDRTLDGDFDLTASWKHLPDAILLAWTPGREAGMNDEIQK